MKELSDDRDLEFMRMGHALANSFLEVDGEAWSTKNARAPHWFVDVDRWEKKVFARLIPGESRGLIGGMPFPSDRREDAFAHAERLAAEHGFAAELSSDWLWIADEVAVEDRPSLWARTLLAGVDAEGRIVKSHSEAMPKGADEALKPLEAAARAPECYRPPPDRIVSLATDFVDACAARPKSCGSYAVDLARGFAAIVEFVRNREMEDDRDIEAIAAGFSP